MESEGLLPHSQVPANCPYPEPTRSSPYPTFHFLKIHLNIILPSAPGSPQRFFPSGFLTKTLYTPLPSPRRATCPVHLILLDFITRTILGEQYRLLLLLLLLTDKHLPSRRSTGGSPWRLWGAESEAAHHVRQREWHLVLPPAGGVWPAHFAVHTDPTADLPLG
jgi:hypothetical protein